MSIHYIVVCYYYYIGTGAQAPRLNENHYQLESNMLEQDNNRTYAKTYSDSSHVWLDSAYDYALAMFRADCSFEQLLIERPHMAKSEWGTDVALELDYISKSMKGVA